MKMIKLVLKSANSQLDTTLTQPGPQRASNRRSPFDHTSHRCRPIAWDPASVFHINPSIFQLSQTSKRSNSKLSKVPQNEGDIHQLALQAVHGAQFRRLRGEVSPTPYQAPNGNCWPEVLEQSVVTRCKLWPWGELQGPEPWNQWKWMKIVNKKNTLKKFIPVISGIKL